MYISRVSRQLGAYRRQATILPVHSRTVAGLGDYRMRNFVLPTDQLSVMPAGAVFVGTAKTKPCSTCGKKPKRLGRLGQDDGDLFGDFSLPESTYTGPYVSSDVPAYISPAPSGGIGTESSGVSYGAYGPPAVGQTVINPAGITTPSSSNFAASLVQAAGQIGAAGITAALKPSATGTCPAGYSLTTAGCVAATGLSALVPGIGITYGWALGIAGGFLVLMLVMQKK